MAQKLAAGNWKMNGLTADLDEVRTLLSGPKPGIDVLLCPAATLLAPMSALCDGQWIKTGGQDCHARRQRGTYR